MDVQSSGVSCLKGPQMLGLPSPVRGAVSRVHPTPRAQEDRAVSDQWLLGPGVYQGFWAQETERRMRQKPQPLWGTQHRKTVSANKRPLEPLASNGPQQRVCLSQNSYILAHTFRVQPKSSVF